VPPWQFPLPPDYRLLLLSDPCKQRVESDVHSVEGSCGVKVARELLVEPSGRCVCLGEGREVRARRVQLAGQGCEGFSDVATRRGYRDAATGQPVCDRSEVVGGARLARWR